MTANVYTDVPALSLHSEMAKLPWITEEGQRLESVSQNGERTPSEPSLPEILQQLRDILQSVRIQTKTNPAPLAEAGFESVEWLPKLGSNQARPFCKPASPPHFASPEPGDTQLRTQDLAALREIVAAWPSMPPELRTACLAVTRAGVDGRNR